MFSSLTDLCQSLHSPKLLSNASVILADGAQAGSQCRLDLVADEDVMRAVLVNVGVTALSIREVVLFDGAHALPPSTAIYGEGFTMLSQTSGTLELPVDVSSLTDRGHYQIPETDGLRTVYGLLMLVLDGQRLLLGFASARRFVGRFSFDALRLRIGLDLENLVLASGQSWVLEEFFAGMGEDREDLLRRFADLLTREHPRLPWNTPPTGWCSWYCFGASVTETDVVSNLDWITREMPALRYVQIDDGYQPWMGDWFDENPNYGGRVQDTLALIRARGFEPALWVAPFVASPESRLFREHPNWFVRDQHGAPLRSDQVGFGGWRLGPWYSLDGTHPEAQQWLEDLFRTMREEWHVTYFKLDANYWGTVHGGYHFDPQSTRVEAYRRGMAAVIKGAGDAFILGCNHPVWPSLGVIHGSRSSGDISRHWSEIRTTGRENLLRGWQNGRLWWNDPDAVVLAAADPKAEHPEDLETPSQTEYQFHATVIYATGGLLLSGDHLPVLPAGAVSTLRKLPPPTGCCFEFEDEDLRLGRLSAEGHHWVALFNWSDGEESHLVSLPEGCRVIDFWTGQSLDVPVDHVWRMLPRSARLLEVS